MELVVEVYQLWFWEASETFGRQFLCLQILIFKFVVAGDPFRQLESCVELSKSGEVVISPEAYAVIKDKVKVVERGECWLLEYLLVSYSFALFTNAGIWFQNSKYNTNSIYWFSEGKQVYHITYNKALRSFLQPPVLKKLDSGFDSHLWMSDLRKVSVHLHMFLVLISKVLFINIGELSISGKSKLDLRVLNMVLVTIQAVVLQYEGFIRQFLVDDKVFFFIFLFALNSRELYLLLPLEFLFKATKMM